MRERQWLIIEVVRQNGLRAPRQRTDRTYGERFHGNPNYEPATRSGGSSSLDVDQLFNWVVQSTDWMTMLHPSVA
jgi:hypothetical protein